MHIPDHCGQTYVMKQRVTVFTVPGKVEEVNMSCIEEWLRDITDVLHEIHLKNNTYLI